MKKTGFLSVHFSLWRLMTLGVMVNLLATVLGFAGLMYWALDLFNAFRVQYMVVLILGAVLFLFARKPVLFLLSAAGAIANAALVLPIYQEIDKPAATVNAQGKLLIFNVNTDNDGYQQVIDYLKAERPDVIGLLEINQTWWAALAPLRSVYPYTKAVIRADNFGIALFSRLPLAGEQVVYFSRDTVPTIAAQTTLQGQVVNLVVTHPVPPISAAYAADRDQHMRELGALVRQMPAPAIVAGDFNTPPWSAVFQQLLKTANVHDSRQGFGIHPTWPSFLKILYTPIDHVLASPGIQIIERKRGPALGSDHHPVVVTFSVKTSR